MNKNIFIVGAGSAGRELVREIKKHPKLHLTVKGFIDDKSSLRGKKVSGVPVLGGIAVLAEQIALHDVNEVFIAMPSVKGEILREVINNCKDLKISFKIIPRSLDIIKGKVSFTQVKPVDPADLIGREIVKGDQKILSKLFKNKKILISGACGSIGSEICRQLAEYKPKKLIFFDWWENGMFDLDLEFKNKYPEIEIVSIIGDIKDEKRVEKVFAKEKPQIVFHAAAYKHVPLMEKNITEAVKNNIIGTKNLIEGASKYFVDKFIFISTDKAVNPKSIMGATKLIAEGLIHEMNQRSQTNFIAVRFGNVLDSFGSVLPLFRKQIAQGGPITVTHKDMNRYFMSIPEAVQLIFQSASVGRGGEIFILDMGEPIKIVDLAKLFIKLSGFTPEKDIKIVFTGLRPGEKLTEELFTNREHLIKTKRDRIFMTKNLGLETKNLHASIRELINYALISDEENTKHEITKIVSTLKNHD